jgi:hypothetical protein
MSDNAKSPTLIELPLKETLSRILRTTPKELEDIQKGVNKRQEEIEDDVDKTRKDIERGIRPAGKRFSL